MIRICTGITENYLQRAGPYLNSLREHGADTSPAVFAIDFSSPSFEFLNRLNTVMVDYSEITCPVPKKMLQHGGFVEFAPVHWRESDVVIFTDADAVLQRRLNPKEWDRLSGSIYDVHIGYNKPDHFQTLEDEAGCIYPKVGLDVVEQHFPGFRPLLCRNTGFVSTSLRGWRIIYEAFKFHAAAAEFCFDHYAWVQFVICYVVQTSDQLRLADLPLSVHSHGHVGLHEGVHKVGDKWQHQDEVIYFSHVL